jgi:hypothetical protein
MVSFKIHNNIDSSQFQSFGHYSVMHSAGDLVSEALVLKRIAISCAGLNNGRFNY